MPEGLKCPKCGNEEKLDVKDSRPATGMIRRRRRCSHCEFRFTTYEMAFYGVVSVQKFKQLVSLDGRLGKLSMEEIRAINWMVERLGRDSPGRRIGDGG